MSTIEHPSGDLSDVVTELNMLTDEMACLRPLRTQLDVDSWPVDDRIVTTLEHIALHARMALASIRERDDAQFAAFERMTDAPR